MFGYKRKPRDDRKDKEKALDFYKHADDNCKELEAQIRSASESSRGLLETNLEYWESDRAAWKQKLRNMGLV